MTPQMIQFRTDVRRLRDFDGVSRVDARRQAIERARELGLYDDREAFRSLFSTLWSKKRSTAAFPLTPAGNAQRFLTEHGKNLRYCEGEKGHWERWDGRRWLWAIEIHLLKLALRTVKKLTKIAAREANQSKRKKLVAHAKRSEKMGQLREMIKLAEVHGSVNVNEADFDPHRHPWLLNCENGTVDLRTGELLPHDRRQLIRQLCPVEYDFSAECQTWMEFLRDVTGGDKSLMRFLRIVAGYALTSDTRQKCFFFLVGPTNTGKTTFNEVIGELLGDYAMATSISLVLKSHGRAGHRNDIARLDQPRFVFGSETGPSETLDASTVKLLTGGDTVTARHLHERDSTFKPPFKLFLATNELPKMRGDDDALWTRTLMIPFRHQPKEIDVRLRDKLRTEMPGILAWAVRGATAYHKKQSLCIPEAVIEATTQARAQVAPLHVFIQERCVKGPEEWVSAAELFDAWATWCGDRQISCGTKDGFLKDLSPTQFPTARRRIRGRQIRIRTGISLQR